MFVTIWMCTHEWSLISSRTAAFTFATCHQPLSWSSRFTRLDHPPRASRCRARGRGSASARRPRSGVSRVSRSASAGIGSSDRSRSARRAPSAGAYAPSSCIPDVRPLASSGPRVIHQRMGERAPRRARGRHDDLHAVAGDRLLPAVPRDPAPHLVRALDASWRSSLAIVGWIWALITGQLPGELHRFFCAYIRYATHLSGYFCARRPTRTRRFNGRPLDGYPLDVALPDGPSRSRAAGCCSGSSSRFRR